MLNTLYFTLNFFFPVFPKRYLSLLILILELADLFKLSFFLYFKKRLLYSFGKQYIQDRLHFTIVVKEVIVLNLSYFVDASLLGHVLRSFRSWQKHVSLTFNILFCGFLATLLRKEVSEININTCGWARSQVIRGRLVFLAFVL